MFSPFLPFRRYAQFHGRASRWEYFGFLFIVIIGYPLITSLITKGVYHFWAEKYVSMEMSYLEFSALLNMLVLRFGVIPYALFVFVPLLAVLVRRLHDQDRSAWWLLILLIPYIGIVAIWVMTCLAGTTGPNRFGPSGSTISKSSPDRKNSNRLIRHDDGIIDAEWSEVN